MRHTMWKILSPFVLSAVILALVLIQTDGVSAPSGNSLIKLACPDGADVNHPCRAVYYYDSLGERHAFPNEKVYFTWYEDFSSVQIVDDDFMASLPLSSNVTYRPGVKMVKFQTDPKVYVVTRGGILRWVGSEEVAQALYGEDWNQTIDDISDAFFSNYQFGNDVISASDYNPQEEEAATSSIDIDKGTTLDRDEAETGEEMGQEEGGDGESSTTDGGAGVLIEDSGGQFETGQNASLMLSGIDFNNTGGSLLFNHTGGIASDGTHLLLVDRFNNRVLIWNTLPTSNEEPDVVLGQPNFTSNNPGTGLDELNWPSGVSTDGKRIVVADSYNNRLLVWNDWPTKNADPADLSIEHTDLAWPWDVWTNGEKLVATSTSKARALVWNTFPTKNNQAYSFSLKAGGYFGTPRTITSNGDALIISDHNASSSVSSTGRGNFVWEDFPSQEDESYDFFIDDPLDPNGGWLTGEFTNQGKLYMIGTTLYVWSALPTDGNDAPDLTITGYNFNSGEPADLVIVGNRLYISVPNSNKVVVYNSLPTSASQGPDFAIGSFDIDTNTLETYHFLTNAVPASNGQTLLVSSDFDRKVYIWNTLPTQSGTAPDVEIKLEAAGWDNALYGNYFVVAGRNTVNLWDGLPTDGRQPDVIFSGKIGSVEFEDIKGVAMDDTYFYVSDYQAGKVYVWKGIPTSSSEPVFTLSIDNPWRVSSDGDYLAVSDIYNHQILIYPVADLDDNAEPYIVDGSPPDRFNLPETVEVSLGRLFIADTISSRIWVWNDIEDAISGEAPSAILGEEDLNEKTPEIGQDKLFWPSGLSFDGSALWVGEYKFGNRLLKFDSE